MSYIVISPPDYIDCKELHNYLIKEYESMANARCVLEFGKNGDHPHLNYLVERTEAPSQLELIETIDAYVKTTRYECGKKRKGLPARSKGIVINKQTIYSMEGLEKYLGKEEGMIVLNDNPPPELEWDFEYIQFDKLSYEILSNIRRWLFNYTSGRIWSIVSDESLFSQEVIKMLKDQGFGKIMQWSNLPYNLREGIRKEIYAYFRY